MNLIQIFAIINLLLSFGVTQAQADNVQAILMKSIATSSPARIEASGAPTPITPAATPQLSPVIQTPMLADIPVRINTATLNNSIRRHFPEGLKGIISVPVDGVVMQGEVDIWNDPAVVFSIDGVVVDPANVNSTRFTNGHHRFEVSAGSEKQSVDMVIKN